MTQLTPKTAYKTLLTTFGRQGWWPVRETLKGPATYQKGRTPSKLGYRQKTEVIIGSILAQNTAWTNASRAVENLAENSFLQPEKILATSDAKLAELIRPSGYYNQKARRLKTVAAFLIANPDAERLETPLLREKLLKLNGVGPETADSMLLYAYGKPSFVVDAYTKRIFGRLGLNDARATYDAIKAQVESAGLSTMDYVEFHALLVELAKRNCTKNNPNCATCPLRKSCNHATHPPHFH